MYEDKFKNKMEKGIQERQMNILLCCKIVLGNYSFETINHFGSTRPHQFMFSSMAFNAPISLGKNIFASEMMSDKVNISIICCCCCKLLLLSI